MSGHYSKLWRESRRERDELREQRDELLEAAKAYRHAHDNWQNLEPGAVARTEKRLDAAIAMAGRSQREGAIQ